MEAEPADGVKLCVYGFDPGTKYGWSVWHDGELVASGVWQTFGGTEHPGFRFKRARQELLHLFTLYPPPPNAKVVIGYEDVHVSVFRDKNNLRVYTGLVASLYEASAVAGHSDIRGIVPASLKVHAVGYFRKKVDGKMQTASKEEVIDACIKKFGVFPETDDQSDAIFVGNYFTENPCPPEPKPKKKKKTRARKSTSTSKTGKRRTRSTRRSPKSAPAQ